MDLSYDAKGLAGCLWGGPGQDGVILSFGMVENKPSPRAAAALEELVKAQFLHKTVFRNGSIEYRPRGPSMKGFRKYARIANFPLAEPLTPPPALRP